MIRRILAILIILESPEIFAGSSPGITVEELRDHVSFLASDSLKGRKPGTPEDLRAAGYIRRQMERCGVELLGDGGYLRFDVVVKVVAGENNSLVVAGEECRPGLDYTPLSFTERASLTAAVTFAGYGFDFDLDSLSWHDYEDVDVSGQWVLVLLGDPEADQRESPFALFSAEREKAITARDNGAAGVLFVSGEGYNPGDELIDLTYDRSEASVGLPVAHIKRPVADRLLSSSGRTVNELEAHLNSSRKPSSFAIPASVSAVLEVLKQKGRTQNVVARITAEPGELRDEYILIGAHYDHLGMGGPGSGSRRPDTLAVHNGADDNASGVSALLELTERLAASRSELKRSVIVAAFAAEEMGTLGSKQFVDSAPIDLSAVKLMVNLDMVGRLDEQERVLTVSGTGTADGFEPLIQELFQEHGFAGRTSPEGYGPSDHAPFYAEEIPVLFFMTPPHQDYHTPFDDVEKLNFSGLKTIADAVYDLVMQINRGPQAPVFQEAGPKTPQRMRHRFKLSLGFMPDFTAAGINGVRVEVISPGRPAELAGMQKGDIIVALDGEPVRDVYEYMHRLNRLHSGQLITVDVLRDGEKRVLIVQL